MMISLQVLKSYHPLIICEGTAEQVIVNKLIQVDGLVFSADSIIDITRTRKARDIQDKYLGFDYDFPVCIVRIADSRTEKFKLGNLYADRFPVITFLTHPEIEVLAIIREGEWTSWRKSNKKPSDFCKQDLRMKEIKSAAFLNSYWDVDSIVDSALKYRSLAKITKDEFCLADLLQLNIKLH